MLLNLTRFPPHMKPSKTFLGSFVILFSLLSLSFMINVYVHEIGHYMTAQALDLDPSLHILNPAQNAMTAFTAMEPIAYVQFTAPTSAWEHFSIAISGVLWNIIFALLIIYLFAHVKGTSANSMLFLALVLPCALSVLINMNPFSSLSDGRLIVDLLVQTLK